MKLVEIVANLKNQLGPQYSIKKQPKDYLPEDEENYVIIERDLENSRDRRIVLIEGSVSDFEIVLSKNLTPALRKKIYGWYIGLHSASNTDTHITVKQVGAYRHYLNERNEELIEFTYGEYAYYSLFVRLPVVSRASVKEALRLVTMDLKKDE